MHVLLQVISCERVNLLHVRCLIFISLLRYCTTSMIYLLCTTKMSGSAHWHDPVALVDWLSRARAASQQREARSTSEDAKAHADEKFTPSDDETLRSTMLREQVWELIVPRKKNPGEK